MPQASLQMYSSLSWDSSLLLPPTKWGLDCPWGQASRSPEAGIAPLHYFAISPWEVLPSGLPRFSLLIFTKAFTSVNRFLRVPSPSHLGVPLFHLPQEEFLSLHPYGGAGRGHVTTVPTFGVGYTRALLSHSLQAHWPTAERSTLCLHLQSFTPVCTKHKKLSGNRETAWFPNLGPW